MMQNINCDLITSHLKEFVGLVTEFFVLKKENFCCIYLTAVIDILRRTRLKTSSDI